MSDGVNESTASTEAKVINGGREAPQSFVALALGSVGVVYGDIGTSPLYAFREAAMAASAIGRRTAFVFIAGVIGAAMFLGDSVITPAISVLSAVEGLKLASPAFSEYVAPLAVIILIGLFAAQSRGTAKVAAMFGPIMVVWFSPSPSPARCIFATTRMCWPRSIRSTASNLCSTTAKSAWSRSARCSWW
jgi:K+ transporter